MAKKDSKQKEATPKKRKNGRAKGQGFERVVAKLLTEWWGEEFHRTPASGGLHWKKDNRVSGDIVPPENSNFPFSVECKKVEGWNFEQVLKCTGDVPKWWSQCIKDSKEVDKYPLLIFSKNRSPVYYMVYLKTWESLSIRGNCFKTYLSYQHKDDKGKLTGVSSHTVVIGEFENLTKLDKEFVVKQLPLKTDEPKSL